MQQCRIIHVSRDTRIRVWILLSKYSTECGKVGAKENIFWVGNKFRFSDDESRGDIENVEMRLVLRDPALSGLERGNLAGIVCLEIVFIRTFREWGT